MHSRMGGPTHATATPHRLSLKDAKPDTTRDRSPGQCEDHWRPIYRWRPSGHQTHNGYERFWTGSGGVAPALRTPANRREFFYKSDSDRRALRPFGHQTRRPNGRYDPLSEPVSTLRPGPIEEPSATFFT